MVIKNIVLITRKYFKDLFNFTIGLKFYYKDKSKLKSQLKQYPNEFPLGNPLPILTEKYSDSGIASGHYFHQDYYVSHKIFLASPQRHIDIGSRIDGFVASVAAFRKIELIDIRPVKSSIENIIPRQADLMQLPTDLIESCDSISSLHAIEHFGLGRYGDPIDAMGHVKAIYNIHKIVKKGGTFYFSTPIGPQRIEFNAHRVFSIKYLLSLFDDKFLVKSFAYVDDKGDIHKIDLNDKQIESNCGCNYGCGIFELIKL